MKNECRRMQSRAGKIKEDTAAAPWDPFRREQLCNLQQQLRNGARVMLWEGFTATMSELRGKGDV